MNRAEFIEIEKTPEYKEDYNNIVFKKTPNVSKALNLLIDAFYPNFGISDSTQTEKNESIHVMNTMRAKKVDMLKKLQEGNKERVGYIYGVPIVTKNATSGELSLVELINKFFKRNLLVPTNHL